MNLAATQLETVIGTASHQDHSLDSSTAHDLLALHRAWIAQESNGTVLSTNWKEIGAKKIDCTPPEGMEAKAYEK